MICPYCHNANESGKIYCSSCGKYLASSQAQKPRYNPLNNSTTPENENKGDSFLKAVIITLLSNSAVLSIILSCIGLIIIVPVVNGIASVLSGQGIARCPHKASPLEGFFRISSRNMIFSQIEMCGSRDIEALQVNYYNNPDIIQKLRSLAEKDQYGSKNKIIVREGLNILDNCIRNQMSFFDCLNQNRNDKVKGFGYHPQVLSDTNLDFILKTPVINPSRENYIKSLENKIIIGAMVAIVGLLELIGIRLVRNQISTGNILTKNTGLLSIFGIGMIILGLYLALSSFQKMSILV